MLVAGALEAVGSLLFISNSKLGSVLLLAFLIPTTVIMHNFWEAPNEQVWKVWGRCGWRQLRRESERRGN